MFKQILVPVDGSELAERAVPCAEHLAQTGGATVHLIQVIDLLAHPVWAPMPVLVPPDAYEQELRHTTAYLGRLRDRLTAAGVAARAISLTGNVGATLLDYERDARIDLVVICTHGRSGLARFALGSVAERLLHYGTAPLLLVRAFGAPVNLAEAVVPLDGSALAEAALPVVEQLIPAVVQTVTLVRIIGNGQERSQAEQYLDACAERFHAKQVSCTRQVAVGDPALGILESARTNSLVVMATHGRTGFTRWALGSVADRVARGGAAAVLALRPGATSAT